MFVNSQQLLFIILFIWGVITLHEINMIFLFLFIPLFYLIPSRSYQKDRTKKKDKGESVMVIRYRGTFPKLGSCQGECPYPCVHVSFFGGDNDGVVDDVGFFLNLRLRMEFCSLRSSISCSRLNILLHSSCLFSCKRRKGINSILGFFALLGRLDFLNSTCMSLV